jgi:hypothetical protein
MPARRYATTWEKPTLRIAAAQFDSWSHFRKAIIRHQFRLRRSPCGSPRRSLRCYYNMKTQPSFKEHCVRGRRIAGRVGRGVPSHTLDVEVSEARHPAGVMEIETHRRINEKARQPEGGGNWPPSLWGGIDRTRADLVRRYYWTQLDEFCTLST